MDIAVMDMTPYSLNRQYDSSTLKKQTAKSTDTSIHAYQNTRITSQNTAL
jgi:hypothetical protein